MARKSKALLRAAEFRCHRVTGVGVGVAPVRLLVALIDLRVPQKQQEEEIGRSWSTAPGMPPSASSPCSRTLAARQARDVALGERGASPDARGDLGALLRGSQRVGARLSRLGDPSCRGELGTRLLVSRGNLQPGFRAALNGRIVGSGTFTVVPVCLGHRLNLEFPLDVDRRFGHDRGWRVIGVVRIVRVVTVIRRRIVPARPPAPPSPAPPGADTDNDAPAVMTMGLAVVRATVSSTATAATAHLPAASAAAAPASLDVRRRDSEQQEHDDQPHAPPDEPHADHPPGTTPTEYLSVERFMRVSMGSAWPHDRAGIMARLYSPS